MKPRFLLCLILGVTTGPVFAEPPASDSAVVESPAKKSAFDLSPSILDKIDNQQDVIQRKHFRLSGPLVRPFKGARLREAPRRFLHVINPFAPTDAEEATGGARVSEQAWATRVGWSTGLSSSDTAITHESKMGLISAGK
jgi:hypothetical protein